MNKLLEQLITNYQEYRDNSFGSKYIRPADIKAKIEKINSDIFLIKKVGFSIEERPIFSVTFGTGDIKILCWTQMHGNEPTATLAAFDIFNFIVNPGNLQNLRDLLLKKLTICFIPVLNPDGAERYQRQNAIGIDLNRDALSETAPESKILQKIANEYQPDYAFNLHDQNKRYTAGNSTDIPATLTFMAPPFNSEEEINPIRSDSMHLISKLFTEFSEIIPDGIGRWDDEYECRAFGDNMTFKGRKTILIESGGYPDDDNNDFVRKLNFAAILFAFSSIADNDFDKYPIKTYDRIPPNRKRLFDLLLKNVTYSFNGQNFQIDIGINREEFFDSYLNRPYYKSNIEEIGDLSTFSAYKIIDCKDLQILKDLPFSIQLPTDKLKETNFQNLYSQGIHSIEVSNNDNIELDYTPYPINISKTKQKFKFELDTEANLFIGSENNIEFVIINGFIIKIDEPEFKTVNGLVLK